MGNNAFAEGAQSKRSRRFTVNFAAVLVILSCFAVVPLSRAAQPPMAAAQSQDQGTDRAYLNGYNTGYQAGQQDRQRGMRANPHKFRSYQSATQGYTTSYGTREQYRQSFQGGFDDGYTDGYANRPESIGSQSSGGPAPMQQAAPASFPTPDQGMAASAPVDPQAQAKARANGYREGYSAGEYDANRGASYNAMGNGEYQSALTGHTDALGTEAQYQNWFRSGFRSGYDDGFNHRLYNSAIGRRDNGAVAQGRLSMPTDPEVLRSRPSGAYSNGILLEEGTQIQARLNTDLSTEYARPGDAFTATVSVPVWAGSTQAIPAGAIIHGTVEQVQRAGRVSGNSQLQLRYDTIEMPGGQFYTLHATTASVGNGSGQTTVGHDEGTVNEKSDRGGDVKKVAGIGGLGAIIGAIAGGGKGAAIGGIAGAAVGTAGVMATRGKDVTLHQGDTITLRLDRPMQIVPRNGAPQ